MLHWVEVAGNGLWGRVNSHKNVTEEGSLTHLGMLPEECRLLSVGSIEGLWVFPQLFHCLVDRLP